MHGGVNSGGGNLLVQSSALGGSEIGTMSVKVRSGMPKGRSSNKLRRQRSCCTEADVHGGLAVGGILYRYDHLFMARDA